MEEAAETGSGTPTDVREVQTPSAASVGAPLALPALAPRLRSLPPSSSVHRLHPAVLSPRLASLRSTLARLPLPRRPPTARLPIPGSILPTWRSCDDWHSFTDGPWAGHTNQRPTMARVRVHTRVLPSVMLWKPVQEFTLACLMPIQNSLRASVATVSALPPTLRIRTSAR